MHGLWKIDQWLSHCLVAFYTAGVIGLLSACGNKMPEDIAKAMPDLPAEIDFNFHVRPILADRCFKCHGPDAQTREAGLRLDVETEVFGKTASGIRPVLSGNLRRSEVWHRIMSDDPELRMPPPEADLDLSPLEKAMLTKWIEQGAMWQDHWAFVPPTASSLLDSLEGKLSMVIDQHIADIRQVQKLPAEAPAKAERLIRRVTMDLTGLPPTLSDVDEFLADTSLVAYEQMVDRLLETQAHAERMALEWLDVARYGDTQGLHTDAERTYWPWRDWVIQAFERNMPYDQFITEQLAGDQLPNPTRDQVLATAFLRLHPMSSEGGIPDEEFRQKYVQERVNTVSTAFMGLTMECASCHDHKFDPFSQRDYYQLSAYFNNMNELGLVNEATVDDGVRLSKHSSGPVLAVPDSLQAIKWTEITERLQGAQSAYRERLEIIKATKKYLEKIPEQVYLPRPVAKFPFEKIKFRKVKNGVVHRIQNNQPIDKIVDENPLVRACGDLEIVPGKIGQALRSPRETDLVFIKKLGAFEASDAYSVGLWMKTEVSGKIQTLVGNSGAMGNGWRGWDFYLDSLNRLGLALVSMLPHNYIRVVAEKPLLPNRWYHVCFTYDGSSQADGISLYVDGEELRTQTIFDNLYGTIKRRWREREGWPNRPLMVFRSGRYHTGENGVFSGSIDELKLYNEELSPWEVSSIFADESRGMAKLDAKNSELQLRHYAMRYDKSAINLNKNIRQLVGERVNLNKEIADVMVAGDRKELRPTFVLDRGQYNRPLDRVKARPLEILFSDSLGNGSERLDLAQWLINDRNPLTARVVVNRYWQMIFGRGLVATPHDFGTQGALPSHPQLLDDLAIALIRSGWDVRALLKSMVLSRTYRQRAHISAIARSKDPDNIYLARGPSYRWPAEFIRDNALAACGLLDRQVGGPSVKPHQPEGIWDFGSLVTGTYEVDTGSDRYRRSLYTYIRRTSPHPAMVAFDAPDRQVCTVKRENTSTPLQALVLLNDPEFIEAAIAMAQKMLTNSDILEKQIIYGFRSLCGRRPTRDEIRFLMDQYHIAHEKFHMNSSAVQEFLTSTDVRVVLDASTASLAMVACSMINFDESYMKR